VCYSVIVVRCSVIVVRCSVIVVRCSVIQCVPACSSVFQKVLQNYCCVLCYGVATISRFLKIIGLFCKRTL